MMKTFYFFGLFILSLFSFHSVADDITEFDYPFLLGNWYWFSDQQDGVESEGERYRAMHVMFKSDYQFAMRLLRINGQVEQWTGNYNIDDTNITFVSAGEDDQIHTYLLNYNRFVLDGAQFTKLAGNWRAKNITGEDVADNISEFALSLRPDFLFSAEISNQAGKKKQHRGVYYLEDDQIVLLYEEGQHDSHFVLNGQNTLTLTNKHFGMEAILNRE